jgi:hypothetical protein
MEEKEASVVATIGSTRALAITGSDTMKELWKNLPEICMYVLLYIYPKFTADKR